MNSFVNCLNKNLASFKNWILHKSVVHLQNVVIAWVLYISLAYVCIASKARPEKQGQHLLVQKHMWSACQHYGEPHTQEHSEQHNVMVDQHFQPETT